MDSGDFSDYPDSQVVPRGAVPPGMTSMDAGNKIAGKSLAISSASIGTCGSMVPISPFSLVPFESQLDTDE